MNPVIELKTLAQDVIGYLNHYHSNTSIFENLLGTQPKAALKQKMLLPSPPALTAHPPISTLQSPIQESQIQESQIQESPVLKPKLQEPQLQEPQIHASPLQRSANIESMLQLLHKFNIPLATPTSPIIFGYPAKGKDEKLFIEKVASTLSTLLLPAEAHPYNSISSLMHSKTLKLIAAPLTFLEKTFPGMVTAGPLHQVVGRHNNILLFSLDDLKNYTNNVELKRSLWNSLKCLKIDV